MVEYQHMCKYIIVFLCAFLTLLGFKNVLNFNEDIEIKIRLKNRTLSFLNQISIILLMTVGIGIWSTDLTNLNDYHIIFAVTDTITQLLLAAFVIIAIRIGFKHGQTRRISGNSNRS